jgi:hypothetical protein
VDAEGTVRSRGRVCGFDYVRGAGPARAGQASLVGGHHQLGPVTGGELDHGPGHVGFHRGLADVQAPGDVNSSGRCLE